MSIDLSQVQVGLHQFDVASKMSALCWGTLQYRNYCMEIGALTPSKMKTLNILKAHKMSLLQSLTIKIYVPRSSKESRHKIKKDQGPDHTLHPRTITGRAISTNPNDEATDILGMLREIGVNLSDCSSSEKTCQEHDCGVHQF